MTQAFLVSECKRRMCLIRFPRHSRSAFILDEMHFENFHDSQFLHVESYTADPFLELFFFCKFSFLRS